MIQEMYKPKRFKILCKISGLGLREKTRRSYFQEQPVRAGEKAFSVVRLPNLSSSMDQLKESNIGTVQNP